MKIRRVVCGLAVCASLFSLPMFARAQAGSAQALALANRHFRDNARAYGLSDPARELTVRSLREQSNRTVIRFAQNYRGVPVFEGEAIARVANGRVEVTNALRGNLSLDIQPGISSEQAAAGALRAIGARGPVRSTGRLEILPQGQRSGRDVLVWHINVEIDNEVDAPASWDYFIDAKTGATVWFFNSLHTSSAPVTGRTMYAGDVTLNVGFNGQVYSLLQPETGGPDGGDATNNMRNRTAGQGKVFSSTLPSFGNNSVTNSDPNTAGADAHYGIDAALDFYLSQFGRLGIDNTGRRSYQRVHFGSNYENAFWSDSCFCMTYGDGASFFYPLVTLDIVAHELTHGVTASEADLTYSGESGGLNESTSDIFGTMVEFFANNAVDTPEYWVGEKAIRSNYPGGTYTQNSALRYMDHPSQDGNSVNCWFPGIGSLDVHHSSGPSNHMFYLLAQGGTSVCNGNLVNGIGRDKAAAIWYVALTDFMTQSTNYHQARTAALNAAGVLYGTGSAEYNATAAAFAAINVN